MFSALSKLADTLVHSRLRVNVLEQQQAGWNNGRYELIDKSLVLSACAMRQRGSELRSTSLDKQIPRKGGQWRETGTLLQKSVTALHQIRNVESPEARFLRLRSLRYGSVPRHWSNTRRGSTVANKHVRNDPVFEDGGEKWSDFGTSAQIHVSCRQLIKKTRFGSPGRVQVALPRQILTTKDVLPTRTVRVFARLVWEKSPIQQTKKET